MKTVSQGHFVQRNLIFAGPGESYLIGRVHRDAQGASKTGYYVWKPDSHPLWRGVCSSSFFDPQSSQESDCNRETVFAIEQMLNLRGIAAYPPFPPYSLCQAPLDNTVLVIQLRLCVPVP